MYCVKCGVELEKGTKVCPICLTPVYYPENEEEKKEFYPPYKKKRRSFNRQWIMLGLTIVYVLLMVYLFLVNLQVNHEFSWSVYAIGGMAVFYIAVLLPNWFKKPNMVIFVPCGFVAAILYALLICLLTSGHWFLSLAFPLGMIGMLIISALVTLLKYCKRGKLFIVGGFIIMLGIYVSLVELFIYLTFKGTFEFWFIYPLSVCVILGLLLIYIGINKPLQEYLKKKLFI